MRCNAIQIPRTRPRMQIIGCIYSFQSEATLLCTVQASFSPNDFFSDSVQFLHEVLRFAPMFPAFVRSVELKIYPGSLLNRTMYIMSVSDTLIAPTLELSSFLLQFGKTCLSTFFWDLLNIKLVSDFTSKPTCLPARKSWPIKGCWLMSTQLGHISIWEQDESSPSRFVGRGLLLFCSSAQLAE